MRSIDAFEAKTHLAALLEPTATGTPLPGLCPRGDPPSADLARPIETLNRFSRGQTLGGLTVRELRDASCRWASPQRSRTAWITAGVILMSLP
jgi:hypothetical protein